MAQNKDIYRRKTFKAAVLSLSLLTIMAGAAVASGIGSISAAFPDVPVAVVKLVVSLPPLLMIFSSLATGALNRRVGTKPLVITGLALFVIGGVGAGFTDSIPQMLVFRAVLGIGTGMILPFSTGLIAASYSGPEKGRMMGYSFSANNLGAMIANILAGILATISWRDMFEVYWIGLVSLLMVAVFLRGLPGGRRPDTCGKGGPDPAEDSTGMTPAKIPPRTYLVALGAMALMMMFYLIVTNLALVIGGKGLGDSAVSGYVFAANTLVMMVMGMLLTRTMRLGRFFVPVFLTVLAAGLLGVFMSTSLAMLVAPIVLCGAGLGSLLPYFINLASEGVPEELGVRVMSVTMGFAWFGQFLSPLFYSALSSATGLDVTCMFPLTSAVLVIVAAVCCLVTGLSARKRA